METHFQPQQSVQQKNLGHGRIENRTVSITHRLDNMPDFPGLQTLIRVESERQVHRANIIEVSTETRYYVASFSETAQAFANRIRAECSLKEASFSETSLATGAWKTKCILSEM